MSCQHVEARGWSMWFSEYIFSKRSCAHDARKLKSDLKDFPQPFWLSVVLERSGFTRGELLATQRLPFPSKVLIPDTKVHAYIKRHATKKWPETDDAVEKWCTEILAAKDALLDEHIAEQTFGNKGLQAIGRPLKCFLVFISLIVLGALKFNFVCCSTLLVLSGALFTGRVLTLFGCGVLSLLQCFMEAAIANISWSEHLKPIVGQAKH